MSDGSDSPLLACVTRDPCRTINSRHAKGHRQAMVPTGSVWFPTFNKIF
jgi:hypothetical protein